MANEISLSASLSATKSGVTSSVIASKLATLSGANQFSNVQNIGTATEALDLGEAVFTPQYMALVNQDATNYVEIGLDTPVTQIFTKLMPGDFIIFAPKTGTMYAKANTAAVNLTVVAIGT